MKARRDYGCSVLLISASTRAMNAINSSSERNLIALYEAMCSILPESSTFNVGFGPTLDDERCL
jgi:hypothetical protein